MSEMLLDTNDLRYVRAEAKVAMPELVSIQRRSLAVDVTGGYTESWADAYQNVPARLAEVSGQESTTAAREDVQASFVMTVGYDQSVEQDDRVTHSSGTYVVMFVNEGRSWRTVKRCQLARL
jgi:SPP1 family predicted phage head-tail adaptor